MSAKTPKKSKPQVTAGQNLKGLMLVRLCLTVAVLGAGYLAWVSLSNGPVAGCGAGSGCDKVLQSRWAYWLGLPVSLPALLVYLGLLAASFFLVNRPTPDAQRRAWMAVIVLSVLVAGAAAWFVGLQVFVIKAFCKFCMTAHACGFTAAVLLLRKAPLGTEATKPLWANRAEKFSLPRPVFVRLIAAGLAGLAVLVTGQVLVEKQRNLVKPLPLPLASATNLAIAPRPPAFIVDATNLPPPPSITNLPTPSDVPSPALATTKPPPASASPQVGALRLLSLHDGRFQIKLDEVPMIGSPTAPHVIAYLFDYTCHHCRQLHPLLVQAQQRFSNQLGIVCLPMPMATNCNPAITRYFRPHANACDYAKLALAVWRAKPEAFRQFDDWLFTPEQPVPVNQARQYAANLLGTVKLESALRDDWITRQIHTDGYLYHSNYLKMGNSQMPELMIGPVISFGPLNSVNDLYNLLAKHLGLK